MNESKFKTANDLVLRTAHFAKMGKFEHQSEPVSPSSAPMMKIEGTIGAPNGVS